jgi:hypothetical protein
MVSNKPGDIDASENVSIENQDWIIWSTCEVR